MEENHFVDRHRVELLHGVTSIAPILDGLLSHNAISQDSYNEIKSLPRTKDKMRSLFSGCLKSPGEKDIFYKILEKTEPLLMDRLKETDRGNVMGKVEIVDTKTCLVETLSCLSSGNLKEFKSLLEVEEDFPVSSGSRLEAASTEDLVKLILETYNQQSVEVTRRVLMAMNCTDLVHKLLMMSSSAKPEHRFALTERVDKMVSVVELLLDMLANLHHEEIMKLRYYTMLMPITDKEDAAFLLAQTYGQQAVMRTKAGLRQMSRTDLLWRRAVTSLKWTEEVPSALIHKVATVAAVKELLFETLSFLRYKELNKFRWLLRFTCFQKSLPMISTEKLELAYRSQLVDLMMESHGQRSVEVTMEVLKDMNRTDLMQWLSESSSGLKEVSAETFDVKATEEESCSELSQKVESLEAALHLLLETLADFDYSEIKKFERHLLPLTHDSNRRLLPIADVEEAAFSVVLTYSQQSVEKTKELLTTMNRPNDVKRLSECSLAPCKPRTDKCPSALIHKVATTAAVKDLLLETLNDCSDEAFEDFRDILYPNIHIRKGLKWSRLQWSWARSDKEEMATQMLDTFGQRSVEVTKKILMNMRRPDVLQRLLEPMFEYRVDHYMYGQERFESMPTDDRILLNHKELIQFRWLLQFMYFQKGLPQIPREYWYTNSQVLMDVIRKRHGQQREEVISKIFKDMKLTHRRRSLSEISSKDTLKIMKRKGQKLEAREGVLRDPSDWTKLSPEVNDSHADESPTYRLQSEAGKFECSVSGLRWVCKDKVSFKFQFCSWDGHMQRMEIMKYMPAGPLIDITVVTGTLDEVYLPHWICIDDDPAFLGRFAVLHIDDCGDVVEVVSEVTSSHVKLSEPVFSPRAALMKWGIPVKISCNVLIFYKPNTTFLKLRVYLIPNDPALQEAVNKKEFSKGFELIQKPRPGQYLRMSQCFTLTADTSTAEVLPEKMTLRYDSQDPNFYEVFIENPNQNVCLSLSCLQNKKRKEVCKRVWTCKIRKDDYSNIGLSEAAGSLSGGASAPERDELCSALQQNLSFCQEETTVSVRERLLEMLEKLAHDDFEKFKWHLDKNAKRERLPCIQAYKLEKADMLELVDLMVQTYCEKAVDMTKKTFEKISRNDLVKILSDSGSVSTGEL